MANRITGQLLNEKWNVGAKHALFSQWGTWFHRLEKFPGALFDPNGYLLFKTEEDYLSCPGLYIAKQTNAPDGISSIPGYRRVNPVQQPPATDIAEPAEPERTPVRTNRIIRDTALSLEVKQLYKNACQICGYAVPLGNGQTYSEAHHIKPLGKPHSGPDIKANIICVCPNHHAQLDYGAIPLHLKDLSVAPSHEIGQEYIDYHNALCDSKDVSGYVG